MNQQREDTTKIKKITENMRAVLLPQVIRIAEGTVNLGSHIYQLSDPWEVGSL